MSTMSTVTEAPEEATGPEPSLQPPGPGVWEHDIDHETRPRTPLLQSFMGAAFSEGFGTLTSRYGLPIARAEMEFVNGWTYMRMVAVGETDKNAGSPPPPPLVMKVISRVHPELRRRTRTARKALTEQLWLKDVAAWENERQQWRERISAAQRVDLATLDHAALADLVAEHHQLGQAMTTRHFELVGPGLGIGLFFAACEDWGVPTESAIAALAGGSTETSATAQQLSAIADAAGDRLTSVETLDELCTISSEVAALVEDYLAEHGWRSLNDDLDQPCLAERPAALLRGIRSADAPDEDPPIVVPDEVPASDHDRYLRLLDEARQCYGSLDDNSGMTAWAIGVSRRTLLEVGRRLTESGQLHDPNHVFELDRDEVTAVLEGQTGPSADDAAARAAERAQTAKIAPPTHLGGEPVAPPPHTALPKPMGQLVRALGLYLGQRFEGGAGFGEENDEASGTVRGDGTILATGTGIGLGNATGRACLVSTPEEALEKLQPGDVLVCSTTSPAYNAVFPMAAAVVTQIGGPLGHAAVTARELGIPAVVGVGDHDIAAGRQIDVSS